ncbi:MAG: hypothetical protein ABSF50_03795 [Burkholderiaceae bacterium]
MPPSHGAPDLAPIAAICGMAFEARQLERIGIHPVTGLNGQAFEARLDGLLTRGCRGLVSFGTAGGLDPALLPGTWVVAQQIVTTTANYECDPVWSERVATGLGHAVRGILAGVDAPLCTRSEKAQLRSQTGAVAVDMESHRAARWARLHGVPFIACRVVIDPALRSLPSSAVAAMQEDGGVALLPLLGELLRHPGQLGALWLLAQDARRARQAMSTGVDRLGTGFAFASVAIR